MAYLLDQLLIDGARSMPDQPAVRYGETELSYAELDARSEQLAFILRALGVTCGDRVGIYLRKSLEAVVAVYGILKAGAAYVPLDPFAPAARLIYLIKDCAISCLVTSEHLESGLCAIAMGLPGALSFIGFAPRTAAVKCHVPWSAVLAAPMQPQPIPGRTEDDLAYILYTSGSTGMPKGIMHTHRSALSFVHWAVQEYGLRAQDRLSGHAPLQFDLSIFDLFAAAAVTATTVLIPEAVARFPASLSQLLCEQKLSVWYSVPLALTHLLTLGALKQRDASALRWVLFAGEAFPTKHLRRLMACWPQARFSNLYGPTETNVCTYYHVSALPEGDDAPIPIGRPCANVETLVLGPDDEPVARGEIGELLVRGASVMRGYWGRQDLDQRAFFVPSANQESHATFYRTGDLVAEQPSGDYRLVGRKDRQIKTRGYRVDLDEIETTLLLHDQVEEAAAYARPDHQGTCQIEAAVLLRASAATGTCAAILTEHLLRWLPGYSVPTKLQILAEFPRTATGKIDRRALQDQLAGSD